MSKNSSSPAAPFSTGYKGYCLFQQMEKKLWKAVHMVQKGAHRGRAQGVVNEWGWGWLVPPLTHDLSSPWNLLELRHQHAVIHSSVGTRWALTLASGVFPITLWKPKVSSHVEHSTLEALRAGESEVSGENHLHFRLWEAAPLLLTAATQSCWSRVAEAEASSWGEQWERC